MKVGKGTGGGGMVDRYVELKNFKGVRTMQLYSTKTHSHPTVYVYARGVPSHGPRQPSEVHSNTRTLYCVHQRRRMLLSGGLAVQTFSAYAVRCDPSFIIFAIFTQSV